MFKLYSIMSDLICSLTWTAMTTETATKTMTTATITATATAAATAKATAKKKTQKQKQKQNKINIFDSIWNIKKTTKNTHAININLVT